MYNNKQALLQLSLAAKQYHMLLSVLTQCFSYNVSD